MSKTARSLLLLSLFITGLFLFDCIPETEKNEREIYEEARPYTRWWWFAAEYEREDIRRELDWLKSKGFGGVEIAFIYPLNRNPEAKRSKWLGGEWQKAVTFTKQYTDSLGLGCDFTFGTLWPFGGTFVPDKYRTKVFGDSSFRQPLRLSWTHPDTGNVLDHLSKEAFEHYAKVMGKALKPALEVSPSALFCDSWEVETRRIWTNGFDSTFKEKYGYDILPYMDSIYARGYEGQRYDYMKLVSELVIENFYMPFTQTCHELGAYSRVQCAGSPTDLIRAYAAVDIPETEAMLYNPSYSRIVASSAALSGKPVVSSETFTCLYGWPREHMMEEKITDLKLVADACFANGVNHIIWHGKPFSFTGQDETRFYATVHVGRKGSLSEHLEDFNAYMTKVSKMMRQGKTYTDVAVYLPLEDAWIASEYPRDLQLPWAWGQYELRYLEFDKELEGFHPLWINRDFLEKGKMVNGELEIGPHKFEALYIDVNYLDPASLERISELAGEGLKVIIKNTPKQAGYIKDPDFKRKITDLKSLPTVYEDFDAWEMEPLLIAENLPDYWCRETDKGLLVFFAHPLVTDLQYPLDYGFSEISRDTSIQLRINYRYHQTDYTLNFKPYQSVMLLIGKDGVIENQSLSYLN